jgi:hypothetical protein
MKHKLLSRIDALEKSRNEKDGLDRQTRLHRQRQTAGIHSSERSTSEKSVSQRTTQLTNSE